MTEAEAACAEIRDAIARLSHDCTRMTDEQWVFRAAKGGWSMAEVVEHVAVSNGTILRLLEKRLLASPVSGRRTGVIDREIPYLFYRGDEPPDASPPTGTWTDRAAARADLARSADAVLAWAAGVTLDLRSVGVEHPVFGLLDGVQWLVFVAAHTERHRAQILGLERTARGARKA